MSQKEDERRLDEMRFPGEMTVPKCPLCQDASGRAFSSDRQGEVRVCRSCEFGFFHPAYVPPDPRSLFGDAYKGRVRVAQMTEFQQRLVLREDVTRAQVDPRSILTSAHKEVLTWLESNTPPGAIVFDIGVGPGYFLRALKKLGFTPMGLDVAEEPVRLLRNEGYQVWHGTVETVPAEWPQPAVCTVFFVLHHVPDPMAFLRYLRVRFPEAVLVVAQYDTFGRMISSRRLLSPTWAPPRTLSFWGPRSLRKAMELAGYKVGRVSCVAMTVSDFPIPATPYLAFRGLLHRLLPVYYAAKPALLKPFALLLRLRHRSSAVLSIGQPA